MDPDARAARASSFGRAVDAYHRARPSYPAAAVAWCLGSPEEPRVVLDVGAGTGRLTAVLLDLGHEVVAVEPDEDMLDQLVEALGDDPRLDTHVGTADDVPLAAASVDGALAAQAWHWFDPDAAGAEAARVVRPGGTLAALWNVRDQRVDWVRAWSQLVEGPEADPGRRGLLAGGGPRFGPGWTDTLHQDFRNDHVLDVADLVPLAASRSRTIALPPPGRAALLDEVRALVDTHPQLAGRARVTLPHVVHCFRATRRA